MRTLVIAAVLCCAALTVFFAGCRNQPPLALAETDTVVVPAWSEAAQQSCARALPYPEAGRPRLPLARTDVAVLPVCLQIEHPPHDTPDAPPASAPAAAVILASTLPEPTVEPAEILLAGRSPRPVSAPAARPLTDLDGPELDPVFTAVPPYQEFDRRPEAEVLISATPLLEPRPELPLPSPEIGWMEIEDPLEQPELANLN